MLPVEVLVGETLTVDGLSTGSVSTGEVTTLKHEAGDDAVEAGALVAEAWLSGAEVTEVLDSLGDVLIEEVHGDAALVRRRLRLAGFCLLGPLLVEGSIGVLDIEEDLLNHGCG